MDKNAIRKKTLFQKPLSITGGLVVGYVLAAVLHKFWLGLSWQDAFQHPKTLKIMIFVVAVLGLARVLSTNK